MHTHYKLAEACKSGDLATVKKYLKQGANIHARYDNTLRLAAWHGHLEIVEYLIEQGAYVHSWGDMPLRYAVGQGHLRVANVLRKAAGDAYKCHRCIIKSTCLKLCDDFRQH
jgi:ankyrin repeat protein